MGYPRKSLICLNDTPYYHVVARCVRRAWLWGFDPYASKDYSHRKQWILQRLKRLADTFAIDLCAYAIMSNHYHLVLHVDRQRSRQWDNDEVVARWTSVFAEPPLIQRWRAGHASAGEQLAVDRLIALWRSRLVDISWYMRCLNEHLARRANAEDECTGRFWEGRFKSQALLDEAGLLTAMAYVDLNPVRAGIAETPEQSEFTSIYQRIRSHAPQPTSRRALHRAPPFMPFSGQVDRHCPALPMRFDDYLKLVDWSARITRSNKRAISHSLPPILARLQIDPVEWLLTMRPRGNRFGRAIGRIQQLRAHAEELGHSWVKGLCNAKKLYGDVH